jgi:hypothetical protein
VLPSFDVQYYPIPAGTNWSDAEGARASGAAASRAWNAVLRRASIGALAAIPPSAPPAHAHFLLRSLAESAFADRGGGADDREPVAHLQAANAFSPSYVGIAPWRAWLREDAGVLPVHYSLGFEPYFVARAPLPSTTPPPLWGVFDEAFRNTWFDKCALFLAAAARDGRALALLPQVFFLNDHALDSVDTAPRSRVEAARKSASWARLEALLAAQAGLTCRSMCPCVRSELVDVMPEQGFLIS